MIMASHIWLVLSVLLAELRHALMIVYAMTLILFRPSMNLLRRFALILCSVLTLGCSQRNRQVDYRELPVNEACILRENIEQVGKIVSFCIIDHERFAISTAEGKIIVYDHEGNQLSVISRRGRGPFEYVEPTIIRAADDNRLIVWCAYLAKFLAYSLQDGSPLFEQSYPFSVRDFVPIDDNIVYAYSGNENAGLVFTYDLSSGENLEKGGEWTVPHSLMMIDGRCPMAAWQGKLYYMPVSELNIYQLGENQDNPVAKIPSGSFHVDNTAPSSLVNDLDRRIEYVIANPRVLLLDVSDEDYYVVALEIKGEQASSKDVKRHNVVYCYDRNSNKLRGSACFPARSPGLIDLYEHKVYYLIERRDETKNAFQHEMIVVIPDL